MKNEVFGEVIFNMGWEISSDMKLFNKVFPIVVSADAYYESERITSEQENAYREYISNRDDISKMIEDVLLKESGNLEAALHRFSPTMLVIRKNGDYAFLINDKEDTDNGLAICIKPKFEVMTTDEYL